MSDEYNELALAACVRVAEQLHAAGFAILPPGYFSRRLHHDLELALEPLTFGRWSLAVYSGGELLLPEKLIVHVAGKGGEAW